MILNKTIKVKLDAKVSDVISISEAYTKAFNYACSVGFKLKTFNNIDIHKASYKDIRKKFNLPSQLACSSIRKASGILKGLFIKNKKYTKCPNSKNSSVRLDQRSYTLFLSKKQCSILTLKGRKKFNLKLSDYHQEYFRDWKYKSADLVIVNKKVYLHIFFEREENNTTVLNKNNKVVGIDRGINNLAVISANKFYSGKNIKNISHRYDSLRRRLQRKGTQSAKRHLKRLSGKEKRFKADVNHKISRHIINTLNPGDTLVLEDLTGIRNNLKSKQVRKLINNWNFYQLEMFLNYKALPKEINLIKVQAYYTSQTCSKCGFCHKQNRKSQNNFKCKKCNFTLNADLNASRNIRNQADKSYKPLSGADMQQPNVNE